MSVDVPRPMVIKTTLHETWPGSQLFPCALSNRNQSNGRIWSNKTYIGSLNISLDSCEGNQEKQLFQTLGF